MFTTLLFLIRIKSRTISAKNSPSDIENHSQFRHNTFNDSETPPPPSKDNGGRPERTARKGTKRLPAKRGNLHPHAVGGLRRAGCVQRASGPVFILLSCRRHPAVSALLRASYFESLAATSAPRFMLTGASARRESTKKRPVKRMAILCSLPVIQVMAP